MRWTKARRCGMSSRGRWRLTGRRLLRALTCRPCLLAAATLAGASDGADAGYNMVYAVGDSKFGKVVRKCVWPQSPPPRSDTALASPPRRTRCRLTSVPLALRRCRVVAARRLSAHSWSRAKAAVAGNLRRWSSTLSVPRGGETSSAASVKISTKDDRVLDHAGAAADSYAFLLPLVVFSVLSVAAFGITYNLLQSAEGPLINVDSANVGLAQASLVRLCVPAPTVCFPGVAFRARSRSSALEIG